MTARLFELYKQGVDVYDREGAPCRPSCVCRVCPEDVYMYVLRWPAPSSASGTCKQLVFRDAVSVAGV